MPRTAVIALGGNAFTRTGQRGTYDDQWENAVAMGRTIADVRAAGWRVVVVHGNGPQVGQLAIQNEEGRALVPSQPLFSLGAMTQGELGSMICLAVRAVDPGADVCALVTHVVVARDDPAFDHPTKPIGPFFSAERAAALAGERGWVVTEDAGRGFRRVVPSPQPLSIVESPAVRSLVDRGTVVVAGGGGGVPVLAEGGRLVGVDAVIDKDYVSARLAHELSADALVLVTGVPQVMLDFGGPTERPLHDLSAAQADAFLAAGEFPEGSMAPKIRAARQFLDGGGEMALVTTPELVTATLQGPGVGTRITAAPTTDDEPHRQEPCPTGQEVAP
jgi:carbamate kinase